MEIVIFLLVLLFSAILHEIAHGAVAEYFGDDTARIMGRISINPARHIDPTLTIMLPLLLYISGSPVIFGAAKPVPVDYGRLRNFRWGVFWVSISGVLTNLFLAFVFTLPFRFFEIPQATAEVFLLIATVNIYLAVINLIPLPPIDGSKVLAALLGERAIEWVMRLEMRGLVGMIPYIVLIFLLFSTDLFHQLLSPVVLFFFRLFGIA